MIQLQWGRDLTVADRACTLAALESTLRRPDTSGMESKLIFEASIEPPPYRKQLACGSASATWGLDAASLLAALSRHENRVLTQFSLQRLGKQTSLHFQQSAIADTVSEERVRYKRLHPGFVCTEEALPPSGCKRYSLPRRHEVTLRNHPRIHGAQYG